MLSYLSLPACNWVFLANTVVADEIYLFTGEFPEVWTISSNVKGLYYF
jgi:hypothetical protein